MVQQYNSAKGTHCCTSVTALKTSRPTTIKREHIVGFPYKNGYANAPPYYQYIVCLVSLWLFFSLSVFISFFYIFQNVLCRFKERSFCFGILLSWKHNGERLKINFPYTMEFTCRSQWPRGLRRRSSAARLLRLWVRISPRAWMFVCCECCVLSGRGLCGGLITRPEELYRMWRVVVCDQETSKKRRG